MKRRRYNDYRREFRREFRPALRLDRVHKKIGGVCAGIANHFGLSRFTVRVLAVIGLFAMPHFTLPAYWLAYLVMEEDDVYEDAY